MVMVIFSALVRSHQSTSPVASASCVPRGYCRCWETNRPADQAEVLFDRSSGSSGWLHFDCSAFVLPPPQRNCVTLTVSDVVHFRSAATSTPKEVAGAHPQHTRDMPLLLHYQIWSVLLLLAFLSPEVSGFHHGFFHSWYAEYFPTHTGCAASLGNWLPHFPSHLLGVNSHSMWHLPPLVPRASRAPGRSARPCGARNIRFRIGSDQRVSLVTTEQAPLTLRAGG